MNKDFWKNRKVLITGHEGFLGSNITQRLIKCGADVTGVDISINRKMSLLSDNDRAVFESFQGDVADKRFMTSVIAEGNFEYIFHLAAEALVGDCLRNPRQCFTTNIEGTWNILEISRSLSAPCLKGIIVASTDKAYGIHEVLPYDETSPLKGDAPYDVSKSCADLIAYTYYKTYSLPVCVTRCGNLFGQGDFNFSRIVPETVRCALKNETLKIRSDGKFVRDYVYIKDIVNAYLMLAEQIEKPEVCGQAFNFSDEKPFSVIEIAEKLYSIMNIESKYDILNIAQSEIPEQFLCSKKAVNLLGWKPEFSIDEALAETIEWYKEFFI